MKASCVLALSAVLATTLAAAQAPDGKSIFKGKVKPGLYEQVDHNEIKGMPGLPKDQEKGTETKRRCVTQSEIDKGLEFRRDCKFTKVEQSDSSMYLVSQCQDGSINEFRLAVKSGGYTTELLSKAKNPDGTPLTMAMRSESRYIGACKS